IAASKRSAPKKPIAKAASKKAAPKKAAPKVAAKKVINHEIVHWEIQAQNPVELQAFYADAFGWKVDANNPMNYGMVSSGGPKGIDGGMGGIPAPGSRVVVYAQVPSIPPVLERIESLGGRTIMPRTDIGPVIMALFHDLEGNTMGLIEA